MSASSPLQPEDVLRLTRLPFSRRGTVQRGIKPARLRTEGSVGSAQTVLQQTMSLNLPWPELGDPPGHPQAAALATRELCAGPKRGVSRFLLNPLSYPPQKAALT